MSIKDLDDLYLGKLGFGGLANFSIVPAASKSKDRFKSGQKWLKNNNLALLVSKSATHSVWVTCFSCTFLSRWNLDKLVRIHKSNCQHGKRALCITNVMLS